MTEPSKQPENLNPQPMETDMQALNEALAESLVNTEAERTVRFRPVERTPDAMAAFMRAGDMLVQQRRERLAQMEFEHHQKIRNLQVEHEKAVAPLKAEIAVLAGRMGF